MNGSNRTDAAVLGLGTLIAAGAIAMIILAGPLGLVAGVGLLVLVLPHIRAIVKEIRR